jgi:hypothetical protein
MYSLEQVKKGLSRPRTLLMELNAQINWFRQSARYYKSGVDIMAEDWDYLIILDALRYDVMKQESSLPGTLSKKKSRGAGTQEWLRGNLRGRNFPDTVYINANPQMERIADELDVAFHDTLNVWESDWDEDLGTVRPKVVRERALQAAERYPKKNLLIHFVQPHDPFIGPTGQDSDFGGRLKKEIDKDTPGIFKQIISSIQYDIDFEKWERVYRENLRIVLPEVEELFNLLEGKFVVSSDHGVLLGERATPIPVAYHGHRVGCHHDNLLTVPWLEFETGERREVIEGDKQSYESKTDQEEVKSRLEDLGYVDP